MPSPFPGMDPYLQDHWRDVHHSFITYSRDVIQEALPPELRARIEERVVLETPEGISNNPLYSDFHVIEYRPGERSGGIATLTNTAAGRPMFVELLAEPPTEGYIEIIDAGSGNRVVTIIEVLSPTNKMSAEGRFQYLHKQREICNSATSLVEIDLVRGGNHVLAVPLRLISQEQRTPYMACVRRSWVRYRAEVYSMPLSQKLPAINIPLRPGDADVSLDLQTILEKCYRMGRYDGEFDYRVDPDPPLSEPEAVWADEMLRSKGLRSAPPTKGKRKRKPPRSLDEK